MSLHIRTYFLVRDQVNLFLLYQYNTNFEKKKNLFFLFFFPENLDDFFSDGKRATKP